MRLLLYALSLSALGLGSYATVAYWSPVDTQESAPSREAPAATSRAPSPAPTLRAASSVETSLSTRTYPVEGGTPEAVLASMARHAPRADGEVFFGLTEAEMGLHYQPVPDGSECVLTGIEVSLALTVTLPDWAPPPDAAPELVRSWTLFRRALAGHEERHREIAEAGAASIVRALDGLRRSSCTVVADEARRRLERVEIEIDAAQRRYDSETGHGRTEGAVWPR